jgi:hypothetical protein
VLGLIEGRADFVSSVAKLGAGYLGGRLEHRKVPAASAYLVTAIATSSFALATSWFHVLLGRSVAWLGRGFRSPLRDTLSQGSSLVCCSSPSVSTAVRGQAKRSGR